MSFTFADPAFLGSLTPAAPTIDPEDVGGCVACWVADDASAAGDGNAVTNWVDRVNGWTLTQSDAAKKPLYRSSAIGGQPALDFDGTNDLLVYAAANAVSTAASGHVLVVVTCDDNSTSPFYWSSSDVASGTRTIGSFISSTGFGNLQRNNDAADSIRAAGALSASTAYLLEVSSTGTAYGLRVNNTPQTITVDTNLDSGDWLGDVANRDNFTVGGYKRNAEGGFLNGLISAVVVVDGTISAGDRTGLMAWAAGKYGITLA